jgi:hypothetical protein
LFTGAENVKTAEQAEKFGGFVGVPYDPCYHSACDTLKNVEGPGMQVLSENIAAMGYMAQRLSGEDDLHGLLNGEKALGNPMFFD